LTLANGEKVRDAKTWLQKRRPEVRKLVERYWFGRAPGRPKQLWFEIVETGAPSFGGKAIRRQVTVHFTKQTAGPRMDLLLYLPAQAKGRVPVFLNMSFPANNLAVADPHVKAGRRWDRETRKQVAAVPAADRKPRGYPVERFLEVGIGFATFNKDDLAPDFTGSEAMGVKSLYLKPGRNKPADDEWGAIAAWAWGASRALDYLETDKGVDAKRVAIYGVSRLGKTSIWAGAAAERFNMLIASCSGEGGAAIARPLSLSVRP